ncbi:heavy-metal-associated domain-containing protein [Salinicoccus sp. ID82-1]|uniref:Heavy-metal-associated domain-containing protein n=1 Tax=Salinicoccus cyprini TaxID=2493691 RepID=A0A558ART1_9STAP|nr:MULTISPECIES: heavy-metal-associated domain-containing protein [Salinicoccus]MCG1009537.1 heavy-metal-associated domain-containing protein [Salinicoccus sp. ID82-1]TVT26971.1 heavy-metal-associated domain-containing protein [Salinicoccus cyprini]
MNTVKFQLEPLTCPSCIKRIEGKVGKMEGVEEVKVLFSSNKVKAGYDKNKVTPDELKAVIEKLGYPVVS